MMPNPVYALVNLDNGQVEKLAIKDEYFKKYIGGKCLAARLLLDYTRPGLDPLSPEALIIINTGPMNGSGAPSSSRFNMSFKNVLTGGIASSNCGGNFGIMLKRAGFDGLMITGRAAVPSVLEVLDGEIRLKPAAELWGFDTEETQARLPAHYGKLVIGPAGEHLVRYASSSSGERMAGRCGSGAVLGSKNLKAITAYGTKRPKLHNEEALKKYTKKWVAFLRSHPITGNALPHYGSAGLVNKVNASHALPTKNFKYGHFAQADALSGEALAETSLVRNSSCISCPIRCERRVMMDGKEIKGPEFETLGFFGPNILSSDLDRILKLNYICDLLGMDTISAASTIAFAMELKEDGKADFGLDFGNTENLADVLGKIARREGSYSELANGTKALSEKYGGKEYAIHSKGLELASYEPRRSVGMGLGYATSNRGGCHLNGGYLAMLESVGVISMDAQSPKGKAEWTVFLQDSLEAISSAGFCLFSAQTFVPAAFFRLGPAHWLTRLSGKLMANMGGALKLILRSAKLLNISSMFLLPQAEALRLATGLDIHTGEFILIGERSYNLERLYNIREGLDGQSDSLPARLTHEAQQPGQAETVVPLDKMLPPYYKARRWSQDGLPSTKQLEWLEIIQDS